MHDEGPVRAPQDHAGEDRRAGAAREAGGEDGSKDGVQDLPRGGPADARQIAERVHARLSVNLFPCSGLRLSRFIDKPFQALSVGDDQDGPTKGGETMFYSENDQDDTSVEGENDQDNDEDVEDDYSEESGP